MPELHPMMARIVEAAAVGDIRLVTELAHEASSLARDIVNIVEWYVSQENLRFRAATADFNMLTGTFDAVKGLTDG